jgi:hypothetical protein
MIKQLDSPDLMPFGKDISCFQDCNSAKIQKYSAGQESQQETIHNAVIHLVRSCLFSIIS